MHGKFTVLSKVEERFNSKQGPQVEHYLVLLDGVEPVLRNTVDYRLTAEENEKHNKSAGMYVGKLVEISINNIEQSVRGRIRLMGAITKVG